MKNMSKKIVSIGLVTGLFLSSVGAASATMGQYKDVNKSDNFYKSVDFLLEKNAISNTLPNFNPYQNITRGQMASILVKVLGLDTSSIENPRFKDVSTTHQFYPYIAALENAGLISGYRDGRFGVNDPLTRGQMSGILTKAYNMYKVGLGNVFNELLESDIVNHSLVGSVQTTKFTNQWADEMATLYYYGLISGQKVGNKTNLNPNKPINRSQFANMIYQIEEDYVDNYAIVTGEEANKYKQEYNYFIDSAVASYPNEFIEMVDTIYTGNNFRSIDFDDDYKTTSNGSFNLLFKVHKEGEIIIGSKGLKLVISKDENDKWKIVVEELEDGEPTTTGDTATITK